MKAKTDINPKFWYTNKPWVPRPNENAQKMIIYVKQKNINQKLYSVIP